MSAAPLAHVVAVRETSGLCGGGLGAFKGKAWRIGLMGHTAREENVTRLLTALKSALG